MKFKHWFVKIVGADVFYRVGVQSQIWTSKPLLLKSSKNFAM